MIFRVSTATKVVVTGFVAFGLAGALLYSANEEAVRANSSAIPYFETLSVVRVVSVFAFVAFLVLAGALVARALVPSSWRHRDAPIERIHLHLHPAALALPIVVILFTVGGLGPGDILSAPTYLASSGPLVLLKLADGLAPFAVVIAAIVAFGPTQTRTAKSIAVAALVVLELLLLARASRSCVVFFLYIFAGGWLTGRWTTRQAVTRAILAATAAFLLVGIPLGLRGEPQHGLIPAFGYLATDPGQFFTGTASPLNNVLLGVPLCMYEGFDLPTIPPHVFWISVNPLPSGATDYAYWQDVLKLNPVEPYSGLGELLNMGWAYTAAFYTVVGAAFEVLTLIGRQARGSVAGATQGIVVGLAGMFIIRSTQYQLRTEARYMYYAAVVVLALTIGSRVLHVRRAVAPPVVQPEPARTAA